MPRSISHIVNLSLERWLPEKRLYLRSDENTRFIRLRPVTQLAALGGSAALLGWAVVATSVLAVDAISAGSARDQLGRSQAALEQRLDDLAAERDASAAQADAAEKRFATALDQVSRMQSQLLASEQRRSELETGIGVVQSNLQKALTEKAAASGTELAEAATGTAEGAASRSEEMTLALDILSGELQGATAARMKAEAAADAAVSQAEALTVERDAIVARNDEILNQIEDAVTVSVAPLEEMFDNVGIDSERLLSTVREGYSGQGGPLTPLAYSTKGDASITESETRGREIMVSLDKLNTYRIAVEKLPLAMPVQSAFRFTSGYGPRWNRKHEGMDMAGPTGTPVYATGDGVVVFAGRQNGYGNLIKIQHALGTETRFAHLNKIHVKVGQRVSRGARIGDMGNTGRSTGPHLHYEVRVNGEAVNPLSFIKAAQNVF